MLQKKINRFETGCICSCSNTLTYPFSDSKVENSNLEKQFGIFFNLILGRFDEINP